MRKRPTHCKRGHPFTKANAYIAPRTGRLNCRQCQRDRQNTPEIKLYQAKYREIHRDEAREYGRQHYQLHRKRRLNRARKRYEQKGLEIVLANKCRVAGITVDQYKAVEIRQNKLCAICKRPETAIHGTNGSTKVRTLSIDHHHATSIFRGLLCSNCNQGLGRFKDSIPLLQAAIAYLQVASVSCMAGAASSA